MPTHIYSEVLDSLSRELDDWLAIKDGLLPLLLVCKRDPMFGRTKMQQDQTATKLDLPKSWRLEFKDIVPANVRTYLSNKGKHVDVRGLSNALSEVQLVAKLTVQAFTGMRDGEARSLPYDCLEVTTSNGKTHYVVLGRTTKLNKGRIKRTRWVTNREGYKAIQIAQQIAETIYNACGAAPKKDETRINDYPLFVSITYLGLSRHKLRLRDGRFMFGNYRLVDNKKLRTRLQPAIEERDLKELEQIDLHRAWREEDIFEMGKPWLLTSHQLRRSLALYAQRSGVVSLPSLRRQLQHITEEMSRYYARGSAFAHDFIGNDKQHFGREWQEIQPISAGLSYIINVLLTDDKLFGGHANWTEYRLKKPDGVIIVDREATLQKFKKGELAYRETLIGGCTKIGECDQVALKWLNIDCISNGCRNLVGNLTKLERVIIVQDKLVKSLESLDPASVEYRTEKTDLDVLVTTRDKVIQQQKEAHK